MVSPGEEGGTSRAAHRAGRVELGEDETFTGQLADVRSVGGWVVEVTISQLQRIAEYNAFLCGVIYILCRF